VIGFRAAAINDALCDGGDLLQVDMTQILGHLLTNTGTQIADAFEKFFDVADPTATALSLPDAVPGTAGGLLKTDLGRDYDTDLKSAAFAAGMVWVDSAGTASTLWPYGTAPFPTDTIARGKTIADANAITQLRVKGAHTLAAAMEAYNFIGGLYLDSTEIITLGGFSVEHSSFRDLVITGACGNAALQTDQTTYTNCYILAVTNLIGWVNGGRMEGACSIIDTGYATIKDCLFGSGSACTLTLQAPTQCDIENMFGELTVSGMDGGLCTISMARGSVLTIDNTCTGGTLTITGAGIVTDNSAGTTVTIKVNEADVVQVGSSTQSLADLKDFADAGYDPATKKVQGVVLVDTTTTNTDMRGTDGANTTVPDAAGTAAALHVITDALIAALNNLSSADIATELATYDGPTKAEMDTAHGLLATSAKLLAYVQLLARSDAAIETDNATELAAINADGGSGAGDYSAQTESQEAIRDRGDAAWITGGGAGITDILNVQALIPNDIDLANTATVRLGLSLFNALDDLPSTAEITPGTITIDRKAIGGTSWSNVVNAAACSEAAGLIYYDEVFDSGTGYAEGDSIRVTFKSQKITVAANDYEITGTDGMMFQTCIRQTMRGTDGANTIAPDAAGTAPTAVEIRQEMDSNSTQFTAIVADTNELQGDWVNGGRLDLLLDQVIANIAALNNLSTNDVNAEVVDVLRTDTRGEPGQGTPPVTASTETKIDYLYKAFRNLIKQDRSNDLLEIYADDGTTVDHKSTLSDDGTIFTRGELVSGA
jgi:hypothetical protein